MSYVCEINNVDDVIRYLKLFFIIFRKSHIFYIDSNYYFEKELRDYLNNEDIAIDYNSLASHKSINLIEIINRILKEVVRKLKSKWDLSLTNIDSEINLRVIRYLDLLSRSIILNSLSNILIIIVILKTLLERDIRA